MFLLSVEGHFSAAHQVTGYPGDCAGMHGHTYKVQAKVAVNHLDDLGMAMDFRTIQNTLQDVLKKIDHTTLNDHPYFKERNATTEHIARYIYEEMYKAISMIDSVTVWEGHTSSVTYYETTEKE